MLRYGGFVLKTKVLYSEHKYKEVKAMVDLPNIDINKVKETASGALDAVAKNEQANDVYEKAAGAVEKKTGVDVPSAADLSKMLDK